ncbi:hypothetical protein [Streptomyces europaeiscabiei]|uniref:hypothetical protein n=1 Tax=Streptomyces europaeiscabiei TaxID=146819 RepID=UPI0038F6A9E5
MAKNTSRQHDRAVRAYMAEHGVKLSVARRALAEQAAAESGQTISEWDGFTAKERRRWEELKLSSLATRQELRLLGEVAAELGSSMYTLDVLRWNDEPVVVVGTDAPDDCVIPRLPRCSDRQDQAWRARMARAFTDIADDLRTGKAPIARCHAEDLALMIAARKVRDLVEQAGEMAGDSDAVIPGTQVLDAAGHLADWYPGLGRVSLRRRDAFTYEALEEALLGSAEIYLLWNDDQGFECPDHPLGRQMMGEDMRAERWFDTFATTIPRDPARGFPEDVWSQLTDHARRSLEQEPVWLGADDPEPEHQPDAAACRMPVEGAPLGTVSAANFMIAAWRQQVLNLVGEAMGRQHHVWHVKSPDQVWELDGRTVLSDIPAVALAQVRRLLTMAVPGDQDELVEIYWSRPAPPGHYYRPLWFCLRVVDIEDHSAGPRDVPWMRVQWADGTVSGVSFTDIVAIRRPTGQDFSPWAPVTGELLPLPTIADYRRPEDDEADDVADD